MQVDELQTAMAGRKRQLYGEHDNLDTGVVSSDRPITSRKRSKTITSIVNKSTYDVGALINELAYTRLDVTFNYTNYNPSSSPVLLCILSGDPTNYLSLWYVRNRTTTSSKADADSDMILRLYSVSPLLQALAIATNWTIDASQLSMMAAHILPVHTLDRVQASIADDFRRFFDGLPQYTNMVTLFDPCGKCIWNSSQIQQAVQQPQYLILNELEAVLKQHLTDLVIEEAMDMT
jgi:hypothetical protein